MGRLLAVVQARCTKAGTSATTKTRNFWVVPRLGLLGDKLEVGRNGEEVLELWCIRRSEVQRGKAETLKAESRPETGKQNPRGDKTFWPREGAKGAKRRGSTTKHAYHANGGGGRRAGRGEI